MAGWNKALPLAPPRYRGPERTRPYRYNPLRAPDPQEWLAFDEEERIHFVREYHRRIGFDVPGIESHIALHVWVENQIALGDEAPAVGRAAKRLMAQGLSRHDMIHAIANILMQQIYDVRTRRVPDDVNASYAAELDRLTAESWRAME